MIGSDHVPYPSWEKSFRLALAAIDDRPIQVSAANRTSAVSGPSGVKMSGPYEYEGPSYYFDPRSEGGANGFNTETSLGPQLPVREDVVRIVGKEHEWPVSGNPYYDYHCTASTTAMNSLSPFTVIIDRRFGASTSLPQFLQRANVVQMEGAQSLFEAFRLHEPQSTGAIHWMLNSAWPSFYWQALRLVRCAHLRLLWSETCQPPRTTGLRLSSSRSLCRQQYGRTTDHSNTCEVLRPLFTMSFYC